MRKIIFTCFAVLIFTAGGFAETKHYFVSRVIDGDTVKLADGSKVRYIGIDTPETRRRVWGGWMWAPEPYAKKAKEYNEELVFGKKVRLEFDKEKRDKYRRLLAYVYTPEGKMVNEEILKKGYAEMLTIPPNTKYFDIFEKAQKKAKRDNLGIWKN